VTTQAVLPTSSTAALSKVRLHANVSIVPCCFCLDL